MSIEDEIRALIERWAGAERAADTEMLDALSADDFTLVGPLGFVLDKAQWLDRYRGGALVTRELEWHDESVRCYHDTAVVIGHQQQKIEYQGHPVDGKHRTTHVVIRRHDEWRLVGIHLSPIANSPNFSPTPEKEPGQ